MGNLWNRDGKLLASVVFPNETTSGWQEAAFPAPVAVTANTTYVISYHTNTGHYAYNKDYFASTTNKSPLRALANGEDGGNGMYRYGASAFPAETWSSSNYWVDVVFKTRGNDHKRRLQVLAPARLQPPRSPELERQPRQLRRQRLELRFPVAVTVWEPRPLRSPVIVPVRERSNRLLLLCRSRPRTMRS